MNDYAVHMPAHSRSLRLLRLMSMLAVAGLAAYLFFQIYSSGATFDADEADHATPGLELYTALKNLDFRHAGAAFLGQAFYPPLNSIGVALAYLSLGPSLFSTRLPSLLWYLATLFVLYSLTKSAARRYAEGTEVSSATWIAVLLAAYCPLLVYNSVLCMLEPLAVFLMSLLLFAIHVLGLQNEYRARSILIVSLLLACIFFEKYSVAVPVTAALFTLAALETRRGNFHLRHWLAALAGFAVPIGFWLYASSPECMASYIADQPAYRGGIFSAENIFFDVRSYFTIFTVSPAIAAFALVFVLAGALTFKRFLSVQFAVLIIGWGWLVMLMSTNNGSRHLLFIAPCLWFLAALGGMEIFRQLHARARPQLVFLFGAGLAILFICDSAAWLQSLPAVLKRRFEGTAVHRQLTEDILQQLKADEPALVHGTTDFYSSEYIRWAAAVKWQIPYSAVLIDEYPLRMSRMQRCRRTVPTPLRSKRSAIRPISSALQLGYYRYYIQVRRAVPKKKKSKKNRAAPSLVVRPDAPWCARLYSVTSLGQTRLENVLGDPACSKRK